METAVSSEILVTNPPKYCLRSQKAVVWNRYSHLPLKCVTIFFPTQHLRWSCFYNTWKCSLCSALKWYEKDRADHPGTRWHRPFHNKDIRLSEYSTFDYTRFAQLFLFAMLYPLIDVNLHYRGDKSAVEMISSLGTTQSHDVADKGNQQSRHYGQRLYLGFVHYYRTHSCTFCLFFSFLEVL